MTRLAFVPAIALLAGCAELDLWHGFVQEKKGVIFAPILSGNTGDIEVTIRG